MIKPEDKMQVSHQFKKTSRKKKKIRKQEKLSYHLGFSCRGGGRGRFFRGARQGNRSGSDEVSFIRN